MLLKLPNEQATIIGSIFAGPLVSSKLAVIHQSLVAAFTHLNVTIMLFINDSYVCRPRVSPIGAAMAASAVGLQRQQRQQTTQSRHRSGDSTRQTARQTQQQQQDDSQWCRLCLTAVRPSEQSDHVRNHIRCRPKAACMYCSFKGATQNSVRVHITWKHTGSQQCQDCALRVVVCSGVHTLCQTDQAIKRNAVGLGIIRKVTGICSWFSKINVASVGISKNDSPLTIEFSSLTRHSFNQP